MKKLLITTLLYLIVVRDSVAFENLSFRGILLESIPCEINKGQLLDVNFGDVGINKIDGVRYLQELSFSVTCEQIFPIKLVYLGTASDFDSVALKTTSEGLGIKLSRECGSGDYCDLAVGGYFGVSMMGQNERVLNFHVVPVKKEGITLEAGEFSASASFRIEYH